jgi:diguanylate cyclase (GGDEF)-like protein/PAS domain S-box-containing protein
MDMLAACGSTHAASLEVYRRVFEDCPDYITISWLDTGVYIDVNPGFQRFTGYRRDEVVGRSSLDLGIWPVLEERHRFIQQIREHGACREFTCHIGRCDGAVVEAEIAGSVTLLDGRPVLLAVVRDVGERHRTQAELAQYRNQLEQLVAQRTEALSKAHAALRVAHEKLVESESQARFQAHHDALTGLPNRALLIDRLEHALSVAHRGDESLALLFIDLNEFKHVNDSLGHQAGDEVLAIVAERLQRCVRKSDTVARLGGDEFVVAVSGTEAAQHAAQIAQKLLKAIEEPIRVRQQICRTAGSIGIAVYPADGDSVALLMQAADTAMYHAKADGKCGYRFHCVQMQAEAQRRHTLDNELHQALVEHQFVLHFQPQFDMRTGRILALEALVRWRRWCAGSTRCAAWCRRWTSSPLPSRPA